MVDCSYIRRWYYFTISPYYHLYNRSHLSFWHQIRVCYCKIFVT